MGGGGGECVGKAISIQPYRVTDHVGGGVFLLKYDTSEIEHAKRRVIFIIVISTYFYYLYTYIKIVH